MDAQAKWSKLKWSLGDFREHALAHTCPHLHTLSSLATRAHTWFAHTHAREPDLCLETVISTCSLFQSWTAASGGTIRRRWARKKKALYLQHTEDVGAVSPPGSDTCSLTSGIITNSCAYVINAPGCCVCVCGEGEIAPCRIFPFDLIENTVCHMLLEEPMTTHLSWCDACDGCGGTDILNFIQ